MDTGAKLSVVMYSTTGICGILFNGILLYLVFYQTPKNLKTYSNLIFNLTVCDLICCVFVLLTQDRIIPASQNIIFIGNGPCQFICSEFCFQSHNIMLHCFTHSLWSALLSFSFRLYVLHHPLPKPNSLRILILICYLPSFFQMIALGLSSDSAAEIKEVLHEYYPQYDNHTGAVYGIKEIRWGLMYTILHVTLPVTPIYIAIVIIRFKIMKHLNEMESMSRQTKLLHQQLLKVLIYQALLPMLFFVAVISYVMGAPNIYHHPLLEYCVFMVLTLIPMLTPLVSLYFVRPYSKWISRCILKQKSNAVETTEGYSQKPMTRSATFASSSKL